MLGCLPVRSRYSITFWFSRCNPKEIENIFFRRNWILVTYHLRIKN